MLINQKKGRMSARFFGIEMGLSTDSVYEMWQKMGFVIKDKFGEWALTDAGRNIGGRMSKSNYCPVPTFDFDVIEKKMVNYIINRKL